MEGGKNIAFQLLTLKLFRKFWLNFDILKKVSCKSSNFIVKNFFLYTTYDTIKVDKEETQELSNQGQNKEVETSSSSLIKKRDIESVTHKTKGDKRLSGDEKDDKRVWMKSG